MTTSGRIAAIAGVNSDPSRRLNVQVTTERDFVLDGGGRRANVTAQVNMRPANAFYLSVIGYYERNVDDLQYVDTAHPDGSPRYVLGRLDQDTLGLTFRANVFVSPDFTIQVLRQPVHLER